MHGLLLLLYSLLLLLDRLLLSLELILPSLKLSKSGSCNRTDQLYEIK